MCTYRCRHEHTHTHMHTHTHTSTRHLYCLLNVTYCTCLFVMVCDDPNHQVSGKETQSWHHSAWFHFFGLWFVFWRYLHEPAQSPRHLGWTIQKIIKNQLVLPCCRGFQSFQTACQDYFISDGFLFFNQPTDGSGCCTAEASCRNHDMFLPRIFTRDQRWSQKVLSSWNSTMLGRGDQWMVPQFGVHTHRHQASISKYDISYFLWDIMALIQNSGLPQKLVSSNMLTFCWCDTVGTATTSPTCLRSQELRSSQPLRWTRSKKTQAWSNL